MASLVGDTVAYWRALAHYLNRGSFAGSDAFGGYDDGKRMKCHVFSLALAVRLWHAPHYRKSSYALDLRDNLRNVAVPGTGVPLSVLTYGRGLAVAFLFVGYPLLCLVAGFAQAFRLNGRARPDAAAWAKWYRQQLLCPRDWFSLWRLNSRLAAWHSLATREARPTGAETEGWHVSFIDFVRAGLPAMVISLAVSNVYLFALNAAFWQSSAGYAGMCLFLQATPPPIPASLAFACFVLLLSRSSRGV